MMLPSECEDTFVDRDCPVEEGCDNKDECEEQEAHITLHALSRHSANNTIKVLGMANGKFLRILIDSGSTNNFLDPQAAKMVKASLINTTPVSVSVADGFIVTSYQQCKGLNWTIQGEEFFTYFRILPLGGIDAVLGVQWLKLWIHPLWSFL